MRQLTAPLLLLVCFISCKKETTTPAIAECKGQCYIIEGTVYEKQTNKKISNSDLVFYYALDQPAQYNPQEIFIGSTKADANGKYSFSFDKGNFDFTNGYVKILSSKQEGYINYCIWCTSELQVGSTKLYYVNINKPVQVDLYKYIAGKISVNLNYTSTHSYDYIGIFGYYDNGGFGEYFEGNPPFIKSKIYNAALLLPIHIRSEVSINGIVQEKNDTVTLLSKDSVTNFNVTF